MLTLSSTKSLLNLTGNLGTRILQFWSYITQADASFTRHKRISDPINVNDATSINTVAEHSAEMSQSLLGKDIAKMQVPKIVTLSSKVVPTEDDISSGDEETSGSGSHKSNLHAAERSLGE